MLKEDFYKNAKFVKGCLEWQRYVNKHGYGYVLFQGKSWSIHRLSYHLSIGKIPKGKWVLHKCDNRKCINPDHLYLGDNSQNVKDRVNRNRSAIGKKHGQSKLNETQVRSIKRLLKKGLRQIDIAERFNISKSVIRDINCHKYWNHIE